MRHAPGSYISVRGQWMRVHVTRGLPGTMPWRKRKPVGTPPEAETLAAKSPKTDGDQ